MWLIIIWAQNLYVLLEGNITSINQRVSALTVYFGAADAEPTSPCFPALKEAVVNVSRELLELWIRRVHQIYSCLTQCGSGDPALGGQCHNQKYHRTDAEYRSEGEHDLFPESWHFTNPIPPIKSKTQSNTTPRGVRLSPLLREPTLL